MNKFARTLATLGPIGSFPAQGTCATVVTLPIAYLFCQLPLYVQLFLAVLSMGGAHLVIIRSGLVSSTAPDPDAIVIDELVGCLVTFIGVRMSVSSLIAGTLLFRFFDIFKPLGIRRVEDAPRYTGIVLDDVAAGIMSNILLHVLMYFIRSS